MMGGRKTNKFQVDMNEMQKQSEEWLLKFYPRKCYFLGIRKVAVGKRVSSMYGEMEEYTLEKKSWANNL